MHQDSGKSPDDAVPDLEGSSEPQAWEMVENGRYRPRRIRGSYRGRELG